MNFEIECTQAVPEAGLAKRFRSWTIEYHAPTETVVITAHGRIFHEDAERQAEEASRLMRLHRTNRVLADFSAGCVEISLAKIYWFPAHYSALTADRRFRVAVVVPVNGHRIGSFKFYEAHCTNAGFNVKLFAEFADAENWLQPSSIA
jgi:hypothetical protein